MKFVEVNHVVKGKGFAIFDNSDTVIGICAKHDLLGYSFGYILK
jgi:hypothetical protein